MRGSPVPWHPSTGDGALSPVLHQSLVPGFFMVNLCQASRGVLVRSAPLVAIRGRESMGAGRGRAGRGGGARDAGTRLL